MSKEARKQEIRAIFDRRVSIRFYDPTREVPRDIVEAILDTAWLSPSSVGLEGWRYLVLDRKALASIQAELKPMAWGGVKQIETGSHLVILLASKQVRYDSPAMRASLIRRGVTDEQQLDERLLAYRDFQLIHMELTSPRRLWDWAAKQTYIALGNMMTTAAMLGVDSCPIEGFDYTAVNRLLTEHGWIDPDQEGVASMLSMGYRQRDPKYGRHRKPREQVIHWVED